MEWQSRAVEGLTATGPDPCTSHAAGRSGLTREGGRLSSGKKFRAVWCFCFSPSKCSKMSNVQKCAVTSSSFPHVCSAPPLVSELPSLILTHENSRPVPYSVPLRTLSETVAGCALGCWPRPAHLSNLYNVFRSRIIERT